ncbi:hypothetical protein NX059_001205 [Plenodomus lindquistii]|nr:hypothetical protein NX059_001205 [Plenodomus lindquistii]
MPGFALGENDMLDSPDTASRRRIEELELQLKLANEEAEEAYARLDDVVAENAINKQEADDYRELYNEEYNKNVQNFDAARELSEQTIAY